MQQQINHFLEEVPPFNVNCGMHKHMLNLSGLFTTNRYQTATAVETSDSFSKGNLSL